MKKVSVLLTKYSDWVSRLIYYISGRGYTHVSLGLEADEDKYYSFNYKGFCIETKEKHQRRGVKKSLSYQIEIPEEVYHDMELRIQGFERARENYHYTKLGVLCAVFQIPFHWDYHYICSQFVAEILKETGAVPLSKKSNLYLPNELCDVLGQCPGLRKIVLNPI